MHNALLPSRVCSALVGFLLLVGACPAGCQEKSVRPGINDQYRKADLARELKRLETEGREAFQFRREIVAACGLRPGLTVADVGSGTGLFTRLIAPAVAPGGKVYAVDISRKLVDHVLDTCREQKIAGVQGVVCTDTSTTLPAGSIDLAFVCDTYHHFEFPAKTLESIRQALHRGGRLIVVDYKKEPGVTADWIMKHVRADQKTVTEEITRAGFRFCKQADLPLKQQYFLVFERAD